jgi:pSer/pThr/pTyr-binding forkhead associated (FHA) protein
MPDAGAYLEVHRLARRDVVVLASRRVVLGRDPDSDVALTDDNSVSRLHAVLEQVGSGWSVTDLGSANGTTVNGERIFAEHRLRTGDEIRVGRSILVYRQSATVSGSATEQIEAAPGLTVRERDVLVALCRPLLSADVFNEPAPTRQIADAINVSEAAVRQHLAHLYDKFGVYDGDLHPRLRLANEAIRRGAVRMSDLREV